MKRPVALALALSVMAGCASSAPQSPLPRAPRKAEKAAATTPEPPPSLSAFELARLPHGTFGPYVGTRDDGALVVFATRVEGRRRFNVVPLTVEGRPRGEPRAIAAAPEELGLLVARGVGDGYVVAYTRKTSTGESVETLCLAADGTPSHPPAALGGVTGRALWVEAVPTKLGTLVFYAAQSKEDGSRAELHAVPLDARCAAGERTTLARDALSWQAVPLGTDGFAAFVRGTPGKASVEGVLLGANGVTRGSLVLKRDAAVELDLDAAAVEDRAIVGWTERVGLEPRVVTAVVDASMQLVAPPTPLTPSEGEQALVRLVPPARGTSRVYAVWENVAAPARGRRVFAVSTVGKDGRLVGPRAELEAHGEHDLPELVATRRGLAALTAAPPCPREGPCTESTAAPFFVELDTLLAPLVAEPLRLEPIDGASADLAFGLGCTRRTCLALGVLAQAPSPLFATVLEGRSESFRAPVRAVDTTRTPRVIEHEAIAAAESIADFALATVGETAFLAHVTDVDPNAPVEPTPAPDGRPDPVRARLSLDVLGAELSPGAPASASPISIRAHSFGGVALAPGDPKRGELLVAWAGVDAGRPQVFVTLVGKDGKRRAQRMLTRSKGDIGDVAAVWVNDGWIVGWVDTQSGDPEVYAAKLDPQLNRVGTEQALTKTEGGAADLVLALDGTRVLAAYSEARGPEGAGDIFGVSLRAKDATPQGDPIRFSETRAHSFSPVLAQKGEALVLAWLERSADEANTPLASVAFTELEGGAPRGVTTFAAGPGEPRALGVTCTDAACRL
ncbi:MAG: hypothetical protein DIU78_020800, partial [Pseudomonadota bacterium]